MPESLDALSRVITDVVAPAAADVDRLGTFPAASIAALGDAGILGLVSATEVGGGGAGLDTAASVIERLAAACGSTAMIVLMHYASTAVIEAQGAESLRRAVAAGDHLTTLAFSETGSRSHFWAPQSTATADGDDVRLDAHKSWVTAAGHAASYVWSSRPLAADGPDDPLGGARATPRASAWPAPSTGSGCGATTRRRSPPTACASAATRCWAPTVPGSTSR